MTFRCRSKASRGTNEAVLTQKQKKKKIPRVRADGMPRPPPAATGATEQENGFSGETKVRRTRQEGGREGWRWQ